MAVCICKKYIFPAPYAFWLLNCFSSSCSVYYLNRLQLLCLPLHHQSVHIIYIYIYIYNLFLIISVFFKVYSGCSPSPKTGEMMNLCHIYPWHVVGGFKFSYPSPRLAIHQRLENPICLILFIAVRRTDCINPYCMGTEYASFW